MTGAPVTVGIPEIPIGEVTGKRKIIAGHIAFLLDIKGIIVYNDA